MGLFVINIVFGFSALLLFLAAFGTMLGLIGVGASVYVVYALVNYFVQQGWSACIKLSLAAEAMGILMYATVKGAFKFLKDKAQTLFKKNVQPTLLTSA